MTTKTAGIAPLTAPQGAGRGAGGTGAAGGVEASFVGSTRLGIAFTLVLAAPVALFFWFAAYSPATLAGPATGAGPTSVWIVYGVGLILYATLLNGLYVFVTDRAARRAGARAAATAGDTAGNTAGAWAGPGGRALGALALAAGALAASGLAAPPARAAEAAQAAAGSGGPNAIAVTFFVVLVAATLGITYWAARRTRSTTDFYAAGGHLTAAQNGLAMAGDTISAGAFLGLSGLTFASGYDGLLYATGYCVAYPVIGILFADRMRNLGRFTFADVVSYRLQQGPVRIFAALSTLTIAIFFLISQMVGAGQLVQLLFNIDYNYAEVIVGVLMVCYVLFGGMMATTWVQIVKAVLMLCTGVAISCLILGRFGWSYDALLTKAAELHPKHLAMLAPAGFAAAPLSTLSLGLAMFVGSAGLPHLIMRVFTVADARTARSSMFLGVICISSFFAMISIIGLGAVALVAGNPDYVLPSGALRGGGNMAAVHLSHAVGGDLMLGFVAAVAFATIIAVVAGLTLSGAAAVSHDIYASVMRRGRADERAEVRISRAATVVLGLLAVGLGIAFRGQNIAYLIGLVVGIAAAANVPLLVLSLYWGGLTTRGAVLGGATGLGLSVVLTVLGPSVWVKVLGYAAPVFPLDPPTLVALPAAVVVCIAVSLLDRSRRAGIDRAGFAEQSRRMHGGAPAPLTPVLAAAE